MLCINAHYLKLKAGYLFPEIERRVNRFVESNPDSQIIKLGIGDVTEPLPPAVIEAMHQAVYEMANRNTFRGYGPEQGYTFLREKIAEHDYAARGCDISPDEMERRESFRKDIDMLRKTIRAHKKEDDRETIPSNASGP